jgi:osmoprotectant transport system ATP-binding protein
MKEPQLVLQLEGVRKKFGEVTAVADVTLRVAAGECVALVGESGSGKSTLLRTVNRLVEPDQGRVVLNGRNVEEFDPVELRRSVGYVPQDGGLLPHWRVLRNVALVPTLWGSADADGRARAALELVGLTHSEHGGRWPHELSGGQRQRVAIARALAARPLFLLLDEPFSALDAITRSEVQAAFEQVREQTQVSSLLVTHDLSEAARLGDRIAVLRAGRIEQIGSAREVLKRPATPYVSDLVNRAMSAWPAELLS